MQTGFPAALLIAACVAAQHAGRHEADSLMSVDAGAWPAYHECALHFAQNLRVRLSGEGGVTAHLVAGPSREELRSQRRLRLPFASDLDPEAGEWRSVPFATGWLAGLFAGEWGGGLWWARPGVPATLLREGPVTGPVAGPGGSVAIVSDLITDRSELLVVRLRDGVPDVSSRAAIAGSSLVLVESIGDQGVLIVTFSEVLRWDGERLVRLAGEFAGRELLRGSLSMTADPEFAYLGISLLLARVPLDGSGQVDWFVPAQCRTFTYVPDVITIERLGLSETVNRCECTG